MGAILEAGGSHAETFKKVQSVGFTAMIFSFNPLANKSTGTPTPTLSEFFEWVKEG